MTNEPIKLHHHEPTEGCPEPEDPNTIEPSYPRTMLRHQALDWAIQLRKSIPIPEEFNPKALTQQTLDTADALYDWLNK